MLSDGKDNPDNVVVYVLNESMISMNQILPSMFVSYIKHTVHNPK